MSCKLIERKREVMENNEVKKKKIKTTKSQIAGRVIAALMVIFMLGTSCSLLLSVIFNG